MEKTKASILALYEILSEYSDEEHILTRKDLETKLEQQYHITLERRKLYDDIEILQSFGVDISTFKENNKGYYLVSRSFERSEAYFLFNAIHAAHFIPAGHSKQLIQKLLKTQSHYVAKAMQDEYYIQNLHKTQNRQFFTNVEVLLDAINHKRVVSFIYMRYDFDKRLIPRRKEPYILHPYHIVHMNENLYLLCKDDRHEDITHYRLDRITNIRILDRATKPLDKDFDPYEYAKTKQYMYSGEACAIEMRCHNRILDDVIDRFGENIILQRDGEAHFKTRVKSTKNGFLFWALQYMKYCEVLSPLDLRESICKELMIALAKYQK